MGELLNLVGLSTGVILYAMLLAMVLRAPGALVADGPHDRLPLATAILGLAWNVCALPIYELQNVGIRGPVPYLAAVGFSALGFLPAVVIHSVLRSGNDGIHSATKALLVGTAYTASVIAAVLHIHSLLNGDPVPSVLGMRLLTYVCVALVLPVAFTARRQAGARRALWIAALAAFAVSAWHLTQLHTREDPWPIELLGHHASLPLALAILYQDYPFAFADLFLKRALTLVTLVAAAFIGIAALGLPSRGEERLVIIGPGDVSLIVTLWVTTALVYPRLRRGVSWFVDAIVLGRPDYQSLRATVAKLAQTHDQVASLLDDVSDLLGRALNGRSARWHEIAGSSTHDDAGSGPLVVATALNATIIVPTSDRPQYAIVSHELTGGRRLLSDDVSMFETLTMVVARRIDAIRLTHERYERQLREQEIARLATEAELRALRAQINPHFLFNALTTIGYLIQAAPPRALNTLMRLTALLRSVLRSEGEFTTLGHELDIVESYLEIERARFEERLQVRIEVSAALREARIPPLLLQPLVENAVKHGVAPNRRGGQVTIGARLERGDGNIRELSVTVHDTGAGVTETQLERGRERGLGLRNVERRLACQYGGMAALIVRSSPGDGTMVEIRLPVPVWQGAAIEVGG
jgi:two-component system LytT family sensor kinase